MSPSLVVIDRVRCADGYLPAGLMVHAGLPSPGKLKSLIRVAKNRPPLTYLSQLALNRDVPRTMMQPQTTSSIVQKKRRLRPRYFDFPKFFAQFTSRVSTL